MRNTPLVLTLTDLQKHTEHVTTLMSEVYFTRNQKRLLAWIIVWTQNHSQEMKTQFTKKFKNFWKLLWMQIHLIYANDVISSPNPASFLQLRLSYSLSFRREEAARESWTDLRPSYLDSCTSEHHWTLVTFKRKKKWLNQEPFVCSKTSTRMTRIMMYEGVIIWQNKLVLLPERTSSAEDLYQTVYSDIPTW